MSRNISGAVLATTLIILHSRNKKAIRRLLVLWPDPSILEKKPVLLPYQKSVELDTNQALFTANRLTQRATNEDNQAQQKA